MSSSSAENENQSSNWSDLRNYKIDNVNNLVVASININSIRNKFDQLKLLVNDSIDILIVEETKIDETFPTGQFTIEGYICHLLEKIEINMGVVY